jgi:alkaline phosphatase D
MGATVAWGNAPGTLLPVRWQERREFFAEGVASGDPEPDIVLLWTRRSPDVDPVDFVHVQVAEDALFHHVVATAQAPVSAASDERAACLWAD